MWSLVEIGLAVGVLLTLVTVLSACVCGCKNSNQKASTQNSQRSLPEIPQPVGRHDSGDTASEIYATVNLDDGGTKAAPSASTSRDHPYEHAYAKLQKENHVNVEIPAEQQAFVGANGDEIIDERDAPTPTGPESVVISASVAISGQLPSSQELPYITPPSPLPHVEHNPPQHFSGDSTDSTKGYTSISVREPLSNIRAAILNNKKPVQPHYATVSDDSDEMYAAIEDPGGSGGGGSDTYAQIAPQEVRLSQERELTQRASLQPTDASTRRSVQAEVASTSNATHSRQASASSCTNSAGTLGSPKPEKRQANSPLPPPPPVPPAGHAQSAQDVQKTRRHESPLNHTAAQRQQRISSTGDLHFSHDKMRRSLNEKHQRNNSCVSSSDFYGCNYPVDKHRFSSGDLIRPLVAKELKFDIDEPADSIAEKLHHSINGPSSSDYPTAEAITSINSEHKPSESPSKNLEEMYAKVIKKTKTKLQTEDIPPRAPNVPKDNVIQNDSLAKSDAQAPKYSNDDPGYETIDRKKSNNHGYETISHKARKSSQNQDPGYETVKEIGKAITNFSNNNLMEKLNHIPIDSGPNSMLSSDPGYEHISKIDNSASDSEPNYEVLRNQPSTPPYATIAPNYKMQPTYSVVDKKPEKYNQWSSNNNDEAALEPNYESMPNDPVYTTGSESDPNYESVRPKDPNYECLHSEDPNYESLRRKDPNYESVRSKESTYASVRPKDPNYESVKYFELSKKDPPYEKVHNDLTSAAGVERSDSSAGYEKINPVANSKEIKSSINGEGGTVDDYFQV